MENIHILLLVLAMITLALTIYNTVTLQKHVRTVKEGMTSSICSGYGFKNDKTMPFNDDSSLYRKQY